MPLVYFLTAAGKDALSKKDGESKLPLEYRRLLGVIDAEGHIDVIRGRLRRFSDRLIDEWLKELEDLKLAESALPGKDEDITFTGKRPPLLPPLADEDSLRLAKSTVVAGATLLRSGSYLADERIANLPVVLLTVKAELADIRNGLALGADGYITKPYSKNQLAEVIGRVLKQPLATKQPGQP